MAASAGDWIEAGKALCAQQRWPEAAEAFRRAVAIDSEDGAALSNLSVALLKCGRTDEAVQFAKQAFALKPFQGAVCANLGACLLTQGRWSEAVQAYRSAINREPQNADFWCGLGTAFREQDVIEDAVGCFQQALEADPNHAEAHSLLGNCHKDRDDLDTSIACFRRALQLNPHLATAQNDLGAALELQGKFDEAAACYQAAITLQPDIVEAHWNQGVLMLLRGEFERAWPEYDWQFKKIITRQFSQPRWHGDDIAGKTILLTAEQALGDTIHFIRYAPLVERLGAKVIVESLRPLSKLIATCRGVGQVVVRGEALPRFDVYAPLLSLPGHFRTTLDTVPADTPYLSADPQLISLWKSRLAPLNGLRVGINWQGSGVKQAHALARRRDIPLAEFQPLAQLPDVHLISLQKSTGSSELAGACRELPMFDLGEFDTQHGPFMDTAAIMMNLDLVISSDTSIAHLAGALGVPVWVALPYVPDWRWLLNRSDSPWYPTMRLFRQQRAGDWAVVFHEIQTALQGLITGRGIASLA